jgi:hypothetical protein
VTDPYIKVNAGDTIRSTDWNEIQVRIRSEILSHTHSGGDQGTRLGGDGLNPATAIGVRQLNVSDTFSVGPVGQPGFVVNPSGNVGIGTSDPGENRLQVAGVLRADALSAGKVITSAIEGLTSLSVGSFQAASLSSASVSAETLSVSSKLTAPTIEGVTSLHAAAVQADAIVAGKVTASVIDGATSLQVGAVLADHVDVGTLSVGGDALLRGALAVGPGLSAPRAPLDVSLGDVTDKWQRFVVSLATRWDGASQQVTLGAVTTAAGEQLTAGIMLSNPHVPWFNEESRASVRYGLAGGVATGGWWDAGVRADASFSLVCYPNRSDAPTSITPLTVTAEGKLGVGVVPLGTSANQVQIAGGHLHLGGNALFLRAPGTLGWEDQFDVVKWSSNGDIVEAAGAQGIALGYTSAPNTVTRVLRVHPDCVELGPGVAGKEPNAGKIGYQKLSADALDVVGAGASVSARKVKVWAEGGTVFTGDVSTTRLGIGTPTPAALLSVGATSQLQVDGAGNLVTSGSLRLSALGAGFVFTSATGQLGTSGGTILGVANGGTGAASLPNGVLKGGATVTSMTGTSGKVTRWTNANTLGTGVLTDTGTNVGVGASSPAALLSVGASSQFQVDGSGNVSTSGGVTVTSLAASQAVFTSATSQLTTGTLGVAMGGTGATALTGVLRGNGAGAFSAMNGAAGLVARWTDANTLGAGALTDTGTSVGVGVGASGPAALLSVGATSQFRVDGSGNVSTSGSLTVTSLAASQAVFTSATSQLTTGTLAVAMGGTGATALTGVLRGNGAGAFSAMNGAAGLVARWTDANTLGTGALTDTGTSVGVAGSLSVSGALAAGGGLAVTSGKAVSGVQVIDFREVSRTFGGHTGSAYTFNGTAVFSQTVSKAFIAQTGWRISYDGSREVVNNAGVQFQVTSISGANVNYSITVSLKDSTGTFDDAFSGDLRFNVVAVLANAI